MNDNFYIQQAGRDGQASRNSNVTQTSNGDQASGSITVTQTRSWVPFPTLRLSYRPSLSSVSSFFNNSLTFFSQHVTFFSNDEPTPENETDKSKQYEKNKKKLKSAFSKMQDGMNELEKRFINHVQTLPKEQQEEMVTVWSAIVDYLIEIMNWLEAMSDKLVEDLKQGKKLNKNELNKLFQTAFENINSIKF